MKQIFITAIIVLCTTLLPQRTAEAQFVGGATTAVVSGVIKSDIQDLMDQAFAEGNFLLADALSKLLTAIDAWESANRRLIDELFANLDETSQHIFSQSHFLLQEADHTAFKYAELADALTDRLGQIMRDSWFGDDVIYISSVKPGVLLLSSADSVYLALGGVGLNEADMVMSYGSYKNASPLVQGPTKASFKVPSNIFALDSSKFNRHVVNIEHRALRTDWLGWFGVQETVNRQLTIVSMPNAAGTYELTGVRDTTVTVIQEYSSDTQRVEGKNRRIDVSFAPPKDKDWRWCLDNRGAFRGENRGEDHGRFEHIDWNRTTPYGLVAVTRVDQRPNGKNAWANVGVVGPICRTEIREEAIPVTSGILSWTDDVYVSIPESTKSFRLTFRTSDGRVREIVNTSNDDIFSVTRNGSSIIIRPKMPRELLTSSF